MSIKATITLILPENLTEDDVRSIICSALGEFDAPKRQKRKADLLHEFINDASIKVEPCKDEEEAE